MRKRTLLAILVSIFIVILTKNFWLEKSPFSLSFDISNAENCIVTLNANRKNNNEFLNSKTKTATVKIKEKSTQNIKFEIPTSKKIKKIKFDFKNIQNSKPIEIENIKINNKFTIKDLDNFTSDKAKLSNDGKKLLINISQEENNISILYNKSVNFSTCKTFNPELFIIILILSYLLSYKLIDYVADFSTIKNKSRIETIFLSFFFIILFIPMVKIDNSQKAKNENRMLATYKPLINEENKINLSYGKDFDAWFQDRFTLRSKLIDINFAIQHLNKIVKINNRIYDKKYNLLYTDAFYGLKTPANTEEEAKLLSTYSQKINKFNEYCKKHNIKVYMLIVPRHAYFSEHSKIKYLAEKKDFGEDIINHLKTTSDIKIIYPKKEMQQANKTTPMYFSTDHHWTKKGAYIGYNELIKAIKEDFKNVNLLKESSMQTYYHNKVSEHWDAKFNNGQTFKSLKLGKNHEKKLFNKQFLYYKNPLSKKLKVKNPDFKTPLYTTSHDDDFYYPDSSNNLKVLLMGNSFARNLVEFLPYSFNKTIRLYDNHRTMNMEEYEAIIEEYKPDIIILNFNTANFTCILNMYEPQKAKGEK